MVFLFGPSGTHVVFQEGQNPGFGSKITDAVIQKGQFALIQYILEHESCSRKANLPFWSTLSVL